MARRAEPLGPPAARRPERVAAFRLGLSAESRAAMVLIAKGYRILARRFKTPVGESTSWRAAGGHWCSSK